jgi:hypothetical protein
MKRSAHFPGAFLRVTETEKAEVGREPTFEKPEPKAAKPSTAALLINSSFPLKLTK